MPSALPVFSIAITIGFLFELISYTFVLPNKDHAPLPRRSSDAAIGHAFYMAAQFLSYIRAPMSWVPFLFEVPLALASPDPKKSLVKGVRWIIVEGVRDLANFILSIWVVHEIVGPPQLLGWNLVLYLPISAEGIRLLTEYGQSLFSACWQLLPHANIVHGLSRRNLLKGSLHRYCYYYSLAEEERSEFLVEWLRARSACDDELSSKLAYVRSFHFISDDNYLHGGLVRDVAQGQIWIRKTWTNDPWLLVGLAIRRSPWVFDPRYVARPFYYRTYSARVTTRLVLRCFRYCGPFAIYQFGQEVLTARHALYFRVMRALGVDLEEPVRCDGSFRYDRLLSWIQKKLGRTPLTPDLRPLWGVDETIEDVVRRTRSGETLSNTEIASLYCYPYKYVEEVLTKLISAKLEDE
jgi:hypothetical protein